MARPAALLLAAAPLLLLASVASAEVPIPPAVAWSDLHMLSNFANRGVATPRPAIQGLDADGRIAHDPVAHTQVQEQWLSINPHHGWQPGAGQRNTTGAGRPFAKGTPFASPSSAAPQRSNAIRAQSSHTPSGRATP